MLGRLTYVLRETWASFRRNVTLTAAAIITSAVALLIFGLTLFVQKGFDNTVAAWEGGVEMIVYVDAEASAESHSLVEDELRRSQVSGQIETYSFCNTPCSLEEAERIFAGDPTTRDALTAANIPTSYKVVPAESFEKDQLEAVKATVLQLPDVGTVVLAEEAINVITQVKGFVGFFTMIIAVVLLIAAVLLIWNTIRTAMYARRREIEVMKLVGATDWFIRVPFMLEGLIQGLVGAVGANVALWLINNRWTAGVHDFPVDSGLAAMVVDSGFQATRMFWILIIGMAAGAIGSGIAASRFLDV